jgi:hypothetical protein
MTIRPIVNIALTLDETLELYRKECPGFNSAELSNYFNSKYMFENVIATCIYSMLIASDEVKQSNIDDKWNDVADIYPSDAVESMMEDARIEHQELAEYEYDQHDCVATGQRDPAQAIILEKVLRAIDFEFPRFYQAFINHLIARRIHDLLDVFIDAEDFMSGVDVMIDCVESKNLLSIGIRWTQDDKEQYHHLNKKIAQSIMKAFNRRK